MTAKVISKVVQEVQFERNAVVLDSATQALINEFVATRDMLNSLEKTKKEIEARIREVLGDAEVGVVGSDVRIEVSKRTRKGIDQEKLKNYFSEAYEACGTATEYSVLVVK